MNNSNEGALSMAMPTCPPPPAPAIQFSNYQTNEESHGYALFAFDALQDGDLSLKVSFF